MAESLGDALLYLRTDDQQFDRGITKAHGKAERLGDTLDQTSASADRLGKELDQAGRSGDRFGQQVERGGRQVVKSAGAQRAGMQQLAMQLADVSTMYSLGARPMQIWSTQGAQVIQAMSLMSGGAKGLLGVLGSPWVLIVSSAAMVLVPLIARLFEAEQAMGEVEFATDAMADAQSILGNVFDTTTGKINAQSQALIVLARAQIAAARVEAMREQQGARSTMREIRRGNVTLNAGMGGGLRLDRQGDGTEDVVTRYQSGANSAAQAEAQLRNRLDSGTISQDAYLRATAAITGDAMAAANLDILGQAQESLDTGELAEIFRTTGKDGKDSSSGRSQADIERSYLDRLDGFRAQIAASLARQAASADEEAELALRGVENRRRQTLRSIASEDDLSDLQKERLTNAAEQVAAAERETIEFQRRERLASEAQQLADERYRAETEGLRLQYDLADTQADRQAIALQIYDTEQAYLRSRLEAVALSETANEAERERARLALAALDASAGTGREAVRRSNETELQSYMRYLNRTPDQINEALTGIEIDGLEALNDGITDAIMGTRALGDVFKTVANQIIADLVRIAVQRAVIAPLADALFGSAVGKGGGTGGLLGSLFSGFFAQGGNIPVGTFGIVGENGPEPIISTRDGATVLPNSSLRGMGGGGTIQQHFDLRGAVVTEKLYRDMQRIGRQEAEGAVSAYDSQSLGRLRDKQARFG